MANVENNASNPNVQQSFQPDAPYPYGGVNQGAFPGNPNAQPNANPVPAENDKKGGKPPKAPKPVKEKKPKKEKVRDDTVYPKKELKFAALITYIIAMIALLAGLLVPFTASGEFGTQGMLAMQLPSALQYLKGMDAPLWSNAAGEPFHLMYATVNFFGKFELNIAALAVLVYALITFIGLILIIPAAVSKKTSKLCLKACYAVETIALIALIIYTLTACTGYFDLMEGMVYFPVWNYSVFIALAVTLILLIVQSMFYNGKSRVIKLFLLIFSAIATFALFPVAQLISSLNIKAGNFGNGAFGKSSGLSALNPFFAEYPINNTGLKAYYYISSIVSLLVIINLIVDLIALIYNTNKHNLALDVARYTITLAAVIAAMLTNVMVKVDGAKLILGLLLFVVLAFVFAQWLTAVIRLGRLNSAIKKAKAQRKRVIEVDPEGLERSRKLYNKDGEPQRIIATNQNPPVVVNVTTPVVGADGEVRTYTRAYETTASEPASAPVQTGNATAYTPTAYVPTSSSIDPNPNHLTYNGPTDNFIVKLSNDEKVEFQQVFMERMRGNLNTIPDYAVGGDNKKFFQSVFIYFARVREVVSVGLMNKFYTELDILR